MTPESGPKSSQNHRAQKENDSPEPPPDPPRGGGTRQIKNVITYSSKGSRSDLLATWFFGGLGYQPKKTPFPETNGLLALPPKAARPKKHPCLDKVWFVGLGTPGLQQNHLSKKALRDASDKYYGALSTGRPIDGQTPPNPINLSGLGRFARR